MNLSQAFATAPPVIDWKLKARFVAIQVHLEDMEAWTHLVASSTGVEVFRLIDNEHHILSGKLRGDETHVRITAVKRPAVKQPPGIVTQQDFAAS